MRQLVCNGHGPEWHQQCMEDRDGHWLALATAFPSFTALGMSVILRNGLILGGRCMRDREELSVLSAFLPQPLLPHGQLPFCGLTGKIRLK